MNDGEVKNKDEEQATSASIPAAGSNVTENGVDPKKGKKKKKKKGGSDHNKRRKRVVKIDESKNRCFQYKFPKKILRGLTYSHTDIMYFQKDSKDAYERWCFKHRHTLSQYDKDNIHGHEVLLEDNDEENNSRKNETSCIRGLEHYFEGNEMEQMMNRRIYQIRILRAQSSLTETYKGCFNDTEVISKELSKQAIEFNEPYVNQATDRGTLDEKIAQKIYAADNPIKAVAAEHQRNGEHLQRQRDKKKKGKSLGGIVRAFMALNKKS